MKTQNIGGLSAQGCLVSVSKVPAAQAFVRNVGAFCVVLASLTAAGCSHKQVQQPVVVATLPPPDPDAFRGTRPTSGPQPELHAPVPERKVLSNGLTVMALPRKGLPLVTVLVEVRSGSAQDPAGLEGLAGFTADMLKAGTTKLNADAVADAVETRGTSIDIDVDEDSITLSVSALQDNVGPVFDILAELLQHANFNTKEIERTRKHRLAALTAAQDEPRSTAQRVFRHVLFGKHPYGHMPLGDPKAVAAISRKNLQSYYTTHFRPANAAVVVVGPWSADDVVAQVEKRLGGWRGVADSQGAPTQPTEQTVEVSLVHRNNAPQSQLMIGELGASRADPDYFSMVVENAILGGLFNSRINMNLREDKGYTYGARSAYDFMRARGPFFVSTGVRTDATEPAIREIFTEIEKIRSSDVSNEELQDAKNRYTLSLPGYFQTQEGVAGMLANIFLFDLPLDYFQKLPEQINAVSVGDVRQVAERHLHPEKQTVVVVGDRNAVEKGLVALERGPVVLRDSTGKVLSPEDPKKATKGGAAAKPGKKDAAGGASGGSAAAIGKDPGTKDGGNKEAPGGNKDAAPAKDAAPTQ